MVKKNINLIEMIDKPILSLCIPTYNRPICVGQLLQFLLDELNNFSIEELKTIEIIISDNNSTIENRKQLSEIINKIQIPVNFQLNINKENVGLVNNIIKVNELSSGLYTWCMGDDDIYHKGIVRAVYNEVIKKKYSFIFINHRLLKNDKVILASSIEGIDTNKTEKNVLLDIFEVSGTSLMYISATIHKRQNILNLSKKHTKRDLAFPFYCSFHSALCGQTKIIESPLIDDICDNISWKNDLRKVFLHDVPKVLLRLPFMGYNKRKWKELFISYVKDKGICNIIKFNIKLLFHIN